MNLISKLLDIEKTKQKLCKEDRLLLTLYQIYEESHDRFIHYHVLVRCIHEGGAEVSYSGLEDLTKRGIDVWHSDLPEELRKDLRILDEKGHICEAMAGCVLWGFKKVAKLKKIN